MSVAIARPEPPPAIDQSAHAPKLAVALHAVEPATYTRCVAIREWLYDLGVDRVTLLVIPAPRLHPFPARSPEVLSVRYRCVSFYLNDTANMLQRMKMPYEPIAYRLWRPESSSLIRRSRS